MRDSYGMNWSSSRSHLNLDVTGKTITKGLVVSIFYLRPKVETNGRVRVTGQNVNTIYTENVEMIKLTKVRERRKEDGIQSKDTDSHITE